MFFLLEQRPGQASAVVEGTKYDNGMVAVANPPELRQRQQFIAAHYLLELPDSDGPARWLDDGGYLEIRNRLAGIEQPERAPDPALAVAATTPQTAIRAPQPVEPAETVSAPTAVAPAVPDPSVNLDPAPILAPRLLHQGEQPAATETLPDVTQPAVPTPSQARPAAAEPANVMYSPAQPVAPTASASSDHPANPKG